MGTLAHVRAGPLDGLQKEIDALLGEGKLMSKFSTLAALAVALGFVSACASGSNDYSFSGADYSLTGSKSQQSGGCDLDGFVTNTSSRPLQYRFHATAYDGRGNTVGAGTAGTPQIDPGRRGTTFIRFGGTGCASIREIRLRAESL